MSPRESGDGWTAEFDNGVIVFEFLPGMALDSFGADAYPVYEKYLTDYDADGLENINRAYAIHPRVR